MSGERRILITGGAGFVGWHLADSLSQDPKNRILLVDNFVRGRQDDDLKALAARSNVELRAADLTLPSSFEDLGRGFDEVYHLAAIIGVENVMARPHEVVRVNAISTLLLLDWAVKGGAKHFLFSSTSEAYAWTQQFHPLPIPTPENVPLALTNLKNPRSSYAGSKIFGELAVTQYGLMYQMPFTILRYHNVYGPRMGHEHVIPQIYKRVLQGENPLKVFSANHRRAFCYVSDAVEATIAAMRRSEASGATLNIGNDRAEVTIEDLAGRIQKRAGILAPLEPVPAAHDPVARRVPDISVARRLLGFKPKVDLDAGLDLTLRWYAKAYGGNEPC